MNPKQLLLAGCAVMALSIGSAQAGPCDMTGKSASMHDAGAGPTPETQVRQRPEPAPAHPPISTRRIAR